MNSWIAAVINVLNRALPDSVALNSPNYLLRTRGGITISKTLNLSGNGAQNDNVFQVAGCDECFEILFHVVTATNATTLSGLKFELWDGTAATDITGAVDASGVVAGAMVYKRGLLAQAAVLINADVGRVAEAAANKISFEPFFLMQKTGVNTYVRIAYTGDADTDVDVLVDIRYRPHYSGANIVAV